ncbi:UvrD-helicase domain-containing protein [Porticoccus sp. W117]|uniref:UvrD-helicase domain-containing protein n=1 Tax=Porticoccus sp. W117 TaxID=3054777 RepID=UPI0025944960|nr:UvrD-helicase domain-containing protein [Porticoccus sp. W117]MDM3870158.1 UvrD-helicase domain-containing protein [Porticoccus sp. W117]
MTSQPADHQQRQQALDPNRSFAVAAPAGSGKTGLLTQRVLTLLAGCQHPEEVLAITFTRKAAAEMRHRIVEALQLAQSPSAPDNGYQRQTWELARKVLEKDAEHNWQLLTATSRLRIQTIDGLCRNLARQLVLENGLGELPQPSDNPQALYQEAVRELLKELENSAPESTANALATLLRHLDNNMPRLENLLSGLLAKREQWLSHILSVRDARPYLEQQLQQTIAETLQQAQQQLQPYASELAQLLDYAANNLANSNPDHPLCQLQGICELPPADSDNGYIWQVLLGLLFTAKGEWRKTIDVRSGFPAGKGEPKERKEQLLALIGELQQQDGLLETLQDILTLPYPHYPQKQWQVLQALTELLPQLSARLSLVFLRNNACDFTEITLAALRALGTEDNPSDTALRLDYRIRHILVDEFQDTSSSQMQLLRRLTAGWQQDDGRSLFIVGDGMQSLYGFRSANVGLFLEARRHPIGDIQLQPLDLSVNFRSQNNLVEWVNQLFRRAFPQRDDIGRGAVRYSDAVGFKESLPGDAVTIDAIVDADSRQQEAQLVVEKIHSAQSADPNGSIAVLVRGRSHLRDILPALYQAGLTWQAIDIEPLATKMAVIDVHSLTKALLSPADRIAWLAILRAPWCGLQLADIECLATETCDANPITQGEYFPLLLGQLMHWQHLQGLSEEGRDILSRTVPPLLAGLQQRGRKPLRTWLEGIWLALGGPAALLDSGDLQHVRRYFDLLEEHSGEGEVQDWQAFTQAVDNLYATPPATSSAQLQLMTIHKSKGLEFDTVIIPGLDKATAGNDTEMLLWRERIDHSGQPQLLLGPLQASGDSDDLLFEHLKQEAKLKTRLENARVIYVGATRAIKHLHLLFHLKSNPKEGYKAPAINSLLAPLWMALEPELEQSVQLHHVEQAAEESPTPSLTHFSRLPPGWQPEQHHNDSMLAAYRGRAEGYEADPETEQPDPSARHVGTVLHRTLQQVATEGTAQWNQARIEQQQGFWRVQLQQLGVPQDALPAAIDQLSAALNNTLADDRGQWILNNRHQDNQCELALGYNANNNHKMAVVDRTFIADGERWIVDYKSAQPAGGQDLNDFSQQQISHYQAQLQHYGKLFAAMENLPVRLALYFPLVPYWVEVPFGTTNP